MDPALSPLLDAFAGLGVLVLGEAMLDTYLEGSAGRFCPEAPVPVVSLTGRQDLPGGAANAAVNARSLGAHVVLLSVVGADPEGQLLRQGLESRGVAAGQLLTQPGRRTLTKQRVMAAGQLLLRLDQGSTDLLDATTERELIGLLAEQFPRHDAVLLSDYQYGILTPAVIRALADLQARCPRVLVADSRRLPAFRSLSVTAVKPNYEEAVALLGAHPLPALPDRVGALAPHGAPLLDRTGAGLAVVTLDREGALVFERDRPPQRVYAPPHRQAFVAGAGDTFSAALALSLAAGAPAVRAAELASAAAAVVVGKERTATCSAPELREFLCAQEKYVPDLGRLTARVEFYRHQGRRIVFTNGCFDVLHRGHITLLHRAKALGDVLVVGVNTDAGIRRLKGPERPLNPLEDRVQVLAALGCVDHIISFNEDTPCALIRALRPEAFVKGGDYTRERLPEAPLVEELGGVVHILAYLDDRSTTGLIQKIRGHSPVGPADP
jgi:D-beta-D-heptose 7-phosphate kinase/D-beta-D-heptose 1-phosphate adenosyltransferase